MKRFSETRRFDEEWYSELSLEHKMAYEYIWASADNAGVWSPNFKLGDFQLGKKIDWKSLPEKTGKRIQILRSGEWVLVGFVETQCGNLSAASRPHAVVIKALLGYGLLKNDSLQIVYPETTGSLQDKDKEKDKEPDKEKGKGSAEGKPIRKDVGTLEEIKAFCVEIELPETDGDSCFLKWEGNGWTNGGKRIVCWRSTIRNWKLNNLLPSQKIVANGRHNHITQPLHLSSDISDFEPVKGHRKP